MSDENHTFSNLYFAVQYRRKDGGVRWNNMAAFDTQGAGERYFKAQDHEKSCPWEYRLMDLENDACMAQTPDPNSPTPPTQNGKTAS